MDIITPKISEVVLPDSGVDENIVGGKANLLEPVYFETDWMCSLTPCQDSNVIGVKKINTNLSDDMRAFIDKLEEWVIDKVKVVYNGWFSTNTVTMKSFVRESRNFDYLEWPVLSGHVVVHTGKLSDIKQGDKVRLVVKVGYLYVTDTTFQIIPEVLAVDIAPRYGFTDCFSDGERIVL